VVNFITHSAVKGDSNQSWKIRRGLLFNSNVSLCINSFSREFAAKTAIQTWVISTFLIVVIARVHYNHLLFHCIFVVYYNFNSYQNLCSSEVGEQNHVLIPLEMH